MEHAFDHSRSVLTVPAMRSDPKRPDEHTREIITLLPRIMKPEEGTLALFTSRKQQEEVAKAMPEAWRRRLLIQDTLPRAELLEKHAAAIGRGEGSVIFGLASFAEGIDLPGRLCEHVVIAKIPFAVPTGPVEQTLAEWVTSLGRNPFLDLAVPDAAIRLVQMAGRLLRTETDTGRVTLLDTRLFTARYGDYLLKSLPPFRIERPERAENASRMKPAQRGAAGRVAAVS